MPQAGFYKWRTKLSEVGFKIFLELRWVPQLKMEGTKIVSMVVENLHFLDSLNCLLMCQEHAQIIQPHMEGVLSPFIQYGQQFALCGLISRTQVLWGRLCRVKIEPNFRRGMKGKRQNFNREFVFEIGQDGPLSASNQSHHPLATRCYGMFLKPDATAVTPRGGYRKGDLP